MADTYKDLKKQLANLGWSITVTTKGMERLTPPFAAKFIMVCPNHSKGVKMSSLLHNIRRTYRRAEKEIPDGL